MIILPLGKRPDTSDQLFPHWVEKPIKGGDDPQYVVQTETYEWCAARLGLPAGEEHLRAFQIRRESYLYNPDALWDVYGNRYLFRDERVAFEFKLRFC